MFYAVRGDTLHWSTDAWVVACHGIRSVNLDQAGVAAYLSGRYDHLTKSSFYRGVRQLPPGHFLRFDKQRGVQILRYWQPDTPISDKKSTSQRCSKTLKGLIRGAVEKRLSKNHNAVLLSGGIDSSAVLAHAADLKTSCLDQLRAFTWSYNGLTSHDEADWALEQTTALSVSHKVILAADYLPSWGSVYRGLHPNDPVGFVSDVLMQETFRRLSEGGVEKLLTGDGGDALFTGGPEWYADLLRSAFPWRGVIAAARDAKGSLRTTMRWLFRSGQWLRADIDQFFPGWINADLVFKENREKRTTWIDDAIQSMSLASRTLYTSLARDYQLVKLRHMQRMSQEFNISIAAPLSDTNLVEFIASTPPHLHWRGGVGKQLFRESIRGMIPESLRTRSDKSTILPYARKLVIAENEPVLHELLRSPVTSQLGFAKESVIRQEFKHVIGGAPLRYDLVMFLLLEVWLRKYFSNQDLLNEFDD